MEKAITSDTPVPKPAMQSSEPLAMPVAAVPVKKEQENSMTSAEVYRNIATKPFEDAAQKVLQRGVLPEDVEIRPDGIVYLPQIKYRQRLNEAFGAGAWALMPMAPEKVYRTTSADGKQKAVMVRNYALYVNGQFVAESTGQHRYEDNSNMQYGDVTESVKSDALTRCCKDIGIGSELFDPTYRNGWLNKYAVKVWVEGKRTPQWRRIDRPPFYKETGEVVNNTPEALRTIPIGGANPFYSALPPSVPKATVVPPAMRVGLSSNNKVPVYGDPEGIPCVVCGKGTVKKKNGRYGTFYSCDQYPKCKAVYEWNKEAEEPIIDVTDGMSEEEIQGMIDNIPPL